MFNSLEESKNENRKLSAELDAVRNNNPRDRYKVIMCVDSFKIEYLHMLGEWERLLQQWLAVGVTSIHLSVEYDVTGVMPDISSL
jgi:hypothetical protein